MRTRLMAALLLACWTMAGALAAPAHAPKAPPAAPIQVKINGEVAPLEVPPVERSGKVCVPTDLFKFLGATVHYDNLTRTVKAWRGKTVVLIEVGKPFAYVNLKPRPLDTPAFEHQGKVMVPLRFLGEAMGCKVAWSNEQRTVFINAPRGRVALPRLPIPGKTPSPSPTVVVAPSPTPAASPSPQPTPAPTAAPTPAPTAAPTPAPTSSPAPADTAPVSIREFYHDARGPLQPGDALVLTLIGTPNGKAAFFIEGVAEDVPMREVAPGTYSADYRFPAAIRARGARVYGTLQVGKERAPLALAPTPITVEPPRPHVQKPEPAPGSVTNVTSPRIAGFFETQSGRLLTDSVVIRVNGVDVTTKAYVTSRFFHYTPAQALPAGKTTVEVEGRVEGGDRLKDSWTFEVQSGASIASATHGAQSLYKKGETLNVTMVGSPGGRATFDIGSYRVGLAMQETGTPGTYAGSYTVADSDRVDNALVIVHLQVPGHPTATAQAPIAVTLAGAAVTAPTGDVTLTVTSPKSNDAVDTDFEVRGQTVAGARVSAVLTSRVPIIGEKVVARADGVAGADGAFTLPIHLVASFGGVKYTLVVTATDGQGRTSRPAAVPLLAK